jgi:uncharacterized membrane protein HdeD (DUF308 family)
MKVVTIAGVILVILGILALIFQGITYTKEKQILNIGPFKAKAQETKTIPIPPLVGGLVLAAGVALLITAARGRGRPGA